MLSLTLVKDTEITATTYHFSPTNLAKPLKTVVTMEYSAISAFVHCL